MGYLAACEPAAESLSTNFTTVPLWTIPARSSASQLVRRMQPCDSVLPILSGSGVPIANPLRRSLFGKPLGRQPLQQNRRRGAEVAEAREALQSSVPIWRGRSSSTISPMTLTNNARISAVSRGAAMALLGASLARKYHRRRGCTITKAQMNPNMRYFKNLIEIRCCANH